jgi:glycyl-tRNA synthetase beta chain
VTSAKTERSKKDPANKDLLIEIGTEELPPKALLSLSTAFAESVEQRLRETGLALSSVQRFSTPRRLALLVTELETKQADRNVLRRGPSVAVAYDVDGNPSKAALGFARSCGVDISELGQVDTDKGSCLSFESTEAGQMTASLVPEIVKAALAKLPIPKRMRWGAGSAEFVRPVHWIVLLLGKQVIETEILGVTSGGQTRGHRFHHPDPITLASAGDYAKTLETSGQVIASFEARRTVVQQQVENEASAHGIAVIDAALLDEVTALVEWPMALTASFDENFLELPEEVLIASMQDHQRYFPIRSKQGELLSHFVTVANIQSSSPDAVRIGNQRVIRPRLSDAAFFWRADLARPLQERFKDLETIVYQKQLGSLADKSRRVMAVARTIAGILGADVILAERAAMLSHCDLVTEMVGEFPELQGTMGRYYATRSGEAQETATALDEAYMPRHAGGALPETQIGRVLAIAIRLDSLVGIFATGQKPSGDKDPFGLRRAALGSLRIMLECRLDLDLPALLEEVGSQYGDSVDWREATAPVLDFMLERLRYYYLDTGLPADVFAAVFARRPTSVLDFDQRARAVAEFRDLPAAESLAAANKRISNMLKKTDQVPPAQIDQGLLKEVAEKNLAEKLGKAANDVDPMLSERDYSAALTRLAELRGSVDAFFDQVLVMDEDIGLRQNRLALLNNLNSLFLQIADIGQLRS